MPVTKEGRAGDDQLSILQYRPFYGATAIRDETLIAEQIRQYKQSLGMSPRFPLHL